MKKIKMKQKIDLPCWFAIPISFQMTQVGQTGLTGFAAGICAVIARYGRNVQLDQSFHFRQDQVRIVAQSLVSVDSARALLIMKETQFLGNDAREQCPAGVMPLDQIVALIQQGFVTVLVKIVHPHDPFLVAVDRGPEKTLAGDQQRNQGAGMLSAGIHLVHIANTAEMSALRLN